MEDAKEKSIQWIATEIDDLSLYLRVYRLDHVADMLDEARDALQATHSPMYMGESVMHSGSYALG